MSINALNDSRRRQRTFLLKQFKSGERKCPNLMTQLKEEFKAEPENVLGRYAVLRLVKRFMVGDLSIEDEKRRTGRPCMKLDDRVGVEIAEDVYANSLDIACRLKIPWPRVKQYTNRSNLISVSGMWVPKEMPDELRKSRLEYCRVMIESHSDLTFWDNVLFEGERVLYYNKNSGRYGVGSVKNRLRAGREGKIDVEVKVTVMRIWWTTGGFVKYLFCPLDKRTDEGVYKQALLDVYANMAGQGLLQNDRKWILHRNEGSKVHSPETIAAMGWTTMTHPDLCPDLSPTDYHVMLKFLGVFSAYNSFTQLAQIEEFAQTCLVVKRKPAYYDAAVDILPEKWHRVIETEGEYIATHEKVD